MEPKSPYFPVLSFTVSSWSKGAGAQRISKPDAGQAVFAANRLTGQDLLLITADLTDAQAGLRLTLHCGENETRSYFISQNQEDGAILLEAGA